MEVISLLEGKSVILTANAFTKTNSTFAGWNTAADGSGTSYTDQSTITPTANITLYAQWEAPTTGTENGHEWVDLGLPSGTKWATCNVGADSPEDYGDYFAWGEITPKSSFSSSNYTYSKNSKVLSLSDDAANANWGGAWRMPTKAEIDELCNTSYTTWTITYLNGVEGRKITSKLNGNSIFLPGADMKRPNGLFLEGCGSYWSNTAYSISSRSSYNMSFSSNGATGYVTYSGTDSAVYGLSVRPVLKK